MNDENHVVEHYTSVREHQEFQKQRKRRIGKIPLIFRQKMTIFDHFGQVITRVKLIENYF